MVTNTWLVAREFQVLPAKGNGVPNANPRIPRKGYTNTFFGSKLNIRVQVDCAPEILMYSYTQNNFQYTS